MSITASPNLFCAIARQEFGYLESDFGFTARETARDTGSDVQFNSAKLSIIPSWNCCDGLQVGITAKTDTFWIRPASSHQFTLTELLLMVAPAVLREAPQVSSTDTSEAALRPWLAFHARHLRRHAEPLLKGDLALCEDMLITRYCENAKSIPLDQYFQIFREECATLSVAERARVEAALATRGPRHVYFVLFDVVLSPRCRSPRLLETLNAFRSQYFLSHSSHNVRRPAAPCRASPDLPHSSASFPTTRHSPVEQLEPPRP